MSASCVKHVHMPALLRSCCTVGKSHLVQVSMFRGHELTGHTRRRQVLCEFTRKILHCEDTEVHT